MIRVIRSHITLWKLRLKEAVLDRRAAYLEARLATVQAEHDEIKSEAQKSTLATIGGVVMAWAYAERTIDLWVEVIHAAGGGENIQSFLPPSLDRELDYIGLSWPWLALPAEIEKTGRDLVARVHGLKTFRHNLVHGTTDMNSPGVVVSTLWKVKGAVREEIKTPYTSDQTLKNVTLLVALVSDLDTFLQTLVSVLDARHNPPG